MREFTLPLPATTQKKAGGAPRRTHFILADSLGEMADAVAARAVDTKGRASWSGGLSLADTARTMRTGDMTRVARSDALLARFERFAFATPTKAWRRDVAGAVPNVPAFLAGHPQTMRRRVRLMSAAAPLAVIVDLTTSGGIEARDIERRGAAILALVRILSARRPVELWAGAFTGADADSNGCAMFARIDTAPLDLARAAFAMVGPSYSRKALYSLGRTKGFSGSWPYMNHHVSRGFFTDIIRPAFPAMGEILAIPAAHLDDEIHRGPEAWIEKTLAQLDAPADA